MSRENETTLHSGRKSQGENDARTAASPRRFPFFFFSFLTPRISSGEFPSSDLLSSALSITYLEDLCRRNRDGTCLRQIEFSIASQFSRLLVDWRNERNLQLSYFISLRQVLGLEKSRKQAPLTMPIQDTWSSFYIIISFPRDCLLNFSYY